MLIRPRIPDDAFGVVTRLTAEEAGWHFLNVEVRRLRCGETWTHGTGEHEGGLVVLGGRCRVDSDRGSWPEVGRRATVFEGLPYALYLPRRTRFAVTATSDRLEIAYCWVPTDQDHPPRLVTPRDVEVEIRGGGGATRQIHHIIPPGFGCHRIVAVEVYTPGGNWSSYPPHKHDEHRVDPSGRILEAALEEVYFYQFDRPTGFALQRIYTRDGTLDVAVVVRHNDLVLVPRGYHPVSAAYGYTCYYLNFLAGSAQSLANAEDPDHVWVKETWTTRDPRVPVVRLEAEA